MTAHIYQSNLLSGRPLVMAVTVALHALLFGALMTARNGAVPVIDDWIKSVPADPIVPIVPVDGIGPSDEPDLGKRSNTLAVPLPQDIEYPADDTPTTPTIPIVADSGPGAGVEPEPPVSVVTPLQFQMLRATEEFYPPAAIRLGEEGTAVVQVCVNTAGQLQGAPQVAQSSGFPRLDAAALRWAREALRFTPATRDGTPVASCKGFKVRFNLQ